MITPEKFLALARTALNNGNGNFALKYYAEAIAGGNVEALVELAELYRNGDAGFTQNFKRALELLTRAATLGNARAMNMLGVMYSNGEGVEVDDAKSFEWCLKSAKADNLAAMYNVYCKYRTGDGVDKNIAASGIWLRRAAENGYPQAMYELGRFYDRSGKFRQAFEWFLKAALDGHINAMNDLAYMYSHGKGVEKNPAAGMAWYKLSAQRDNLTAIKNLAYHYGYGVNVEKDFNEAVILYERAIILGDIDAINGLGELYSANGDFREAVKYFQNAASLDNTDAMLNLYNMYILGNGVTANVKLAAYWICRAAIRGNALAKANLGRLFSISSDDGDEARKYTLAKYAVTFLEESAKSGEGIAMLWLADFLANKRDRDSLRQAEYWYYKAEEAEVRGAREKLNALKNSSYFDGG